MGRVWEEELGKRKEHDENTLYGSGQRTLLLIRAILKNLGTQEVLLSLRFERETLQHGLTCSNSWSSAAGTVWRCYETFRKWRLGLGVS